MSNRIFYKTVINVEILSEDPFEWDDLNDVHYAITNGDCSGLVEESYRTVLSSQEAAKELIRHSSDPNFFDLDNDGNDTN